MSPIEIRDRLRVRPFEPLCFHLSDGAGYDVRQPERAVVSQRAVVIAVHDGGADLPERLVYCDPLHITRVEPIPPGRPRRKPTGRKRKR